MMLLRSLKPFPLKKQPRNQDGRVVKHHMSRNVLGTTFILKGCDVGDFYTQNGGWTKPSEKYDRHNGNLPQIGVKIKKCLKPPPSMDIDKSLPKIVIGAGTYTDVIATHKKQSEKNIAEEKIPKEPIVMYVYIHILSSTDQSWHIPFLPQSWKWKTTPNERKLLLEGTIFHFH